LICINGAPPAPRMIAAMPAPLKKFRLLSDKDFWKLSADQKLHYLQAAIEAVKHDKGVPKPGKKAPPKRRG
jgi:hypothetical protein